MTKEELDIILENHKHYITEDCVGWEGMRANLCSADLRRANLYGADLRRANLYGANLSDANLSDASLSGASLRRANLCGADLRRANLCGADLTGANLCDADLNDANLCDADLRNAKNIPYIPMVCPEEGMCIGWKKANDKIIKLEIPADAKRLSATSRKCRCSKAKVLAIYELDGTESNIKEIASSYNKNFIYNVGEVVEVEDFDEDRWNECSTGIHFFINRQEAINY